MSGDEQTQPSLTRRHIMQLLGGGAAAAGLASAFGDDEDGNLNAGTMALDKAYNVSGELWIGPDSARSNVDAKSGRVYIGASGDGYTFYNGDNGAWKKKGLGDASNSLPSVHTDEADITQGAITDNRSAVGPVSKEIYGSCYLDGYYYVIASDAKLYRTQDPSDDSAWEERSTFSGGVNNSADLFATSNGTLLTGQKGTLYRSTDKGASFTGVHTLNDTNVWSFDQNADGRLIATEYQNTISVLTSTDDGASWSTLADGTDLTETQDHVHKGFFHPADKTRIVVTVGDGTTHGYYRSDDTGTTWPFIEEATGTGAQYVGGIGHPTDPNVYFLMHDANHNAGEPRGIVRVEDDGSTVTQEMVLDTLEDQPNSLGGFAMVAIDDPDRPCLVASSFSNTGNVDIIYASQTLQGRLWRPIGTIPSTASHRNMTSEAGAYRSVISDSVDYVLGSDKFVRASAAGNTIYGGARQYRDGESGEYRHLDSFRLDLNGTTVSSTSYSQIGGNADRIVVDFSQYRIRNLTELYVSWSGRLHNTDGSQQDVSAAVATDGGVVTGSEDTLTMAANEFTKNAGPRGKVSGNVKSLDMQMKVSGGTGGEFYNDPVIHLWGRIS